MKVVRQARLELSGGSTPDQLRPPCGSVATWEVWIMCTIQYISLAKSQFSLLCSRSCSCEMSLWQRIWGSIASFGGKFGPIKQRPEDVIRLRSQGKMGARGQILSQRRMPRPDGAGTTQTQAEGGSQSGPYSPVTWHGPKSRTMLEQALFTRSSFVGTGGSVWVPQRDLVRL